MKNKWRKFKGEKLKRGDIIKCSPYNLDNKRMVVTVDILGIIEKGFYKGNYKGSVDFDTELIIEPDMIKEVWNGDSFRRYACF